MFSIFMDGRLCDLDTIPNIRESPGFSCCFLVEGVIPGLLLDGRTSAQLGQKRARMRGSLPALIRARQGHRLDLAPRRRDGCPWKSGQDPERDMLPWKEGGEIDDSLEDDTGWGLKLGRHNRPGYAEPHCLAHKYGKQAGGLGLLSRDAIPACLTLLHFLLLISIS